MNIRPYSKEDYDGVKELLQLTGLYISTLDTEEVFSKKSTDDSESMFVAEKNGEIIGFVMFSYDVWITTIRHLCSHPKKGIGVGMLLASHAIKIIRSRGCKSVCSYTAISFQQVQAQQRVGQYAVPVFDQ